MTEHGTERIDPGVNAVEPDWAQQLRAAFAGRSVFLTGHTGFKGSWLALWLHELGRP